MLNVRVALDRVDSDSAELERLHRRLRIYLEDAGLDRVSSVHSDVVVDGTRGVKETLLGVFDAVLPKLVTEAVQVFARALGDFVRVSRHDITVEINGNSLTIGNANHEQAERLIELFVAETIGEEEN